jgi:hypothetical protein
VNADEFWTLMEASAHAGPTRRDREDFLFKRLWRAPRRHLLDFVQLLAATREPANTYNLWNAAEIINRGWCSDDGFHYFQMWLVGQGRAVYEAAVADPDSLAAAPEVRRLAGLAEITRDEDLAEWETLEYLAPRVGDERGDFDGDLRDVVSEERGVRLRYDPNPDDVEWAGLDTARLALAYPRLWALFADHWREE